MKPSQALLSLRESSSLISGTSSHAQLAMIGSFLDKKSSSMVQETLSCLLQCQQPQHLRFWETMRASSLTHLTSIQDECLQENSYASTLIWFKISLMSGSGTLTSRMLSSPSTEVSRKSQPFPNSSRISTRLFGRSLRRSSLTWLLQEDPTFASLKV